MPSNGRKKDCFTLKTWEQVYQKRGVNMAVCSFLGIWSEIIDLGMQEKLANTAKTIASENDIVDFMIYFDQNLFNQYLEASLEAKTRYPQKVTVTLVLTSIEMYRKFQLQLSAPLCMFDRVIVLSNYIKDVDENTLQKVSRWMIHRSTHVISYIYLRLYELDNLELEYAKKQPGLHIIDVTTKETTQLIEEMMSNLSDREQLIFQKLQEGCTLIAIGKILGITTERVRQIRRKATYAIRRNLRTSIEKEQAKKKLVCGIFMLAENDSYISYQTGTSFEHTVNYLFKEYGISHFKIAIEYRNSCFMNILERLKITARREVSITLVTTGDTDLEPNERIICDCVENIDTTFSKKEPKLSIVQNMMEQSSFCLCSLSAFPFSNEIRSYAAKVENIALLDIDKIPPYVVFPQ